VFSRTEREFLRTVADAAGETVEARLEGAFPNPAYRRKLMWGIRQKARRSLSDWRLYAAAAGLDPRLLPRESDASSPAPPVFADSVVSMLEGLRKKLRGRTRRGRKVARRLDGPRAR